MRPAYLSPADRIALQDVMLNYAAALDERDISRYSACFADAVQVVNFGDRTFHSRRDWVDYVWQALDQYSATQHLLGPQYAVLAEANSNGNARASTRSDVQATHVTKAGGSRFTLWATYYTDMEKFDDQWLITRHALQVRSTATG